MTLRPYRLLIAPYVSARVAKLHPDLKKRARDALAAVAAAPEGGKLLEDDLLGYWSWRVGRFRIIYRVLPDRIVDVLTIGPRRTVYEEARHLKNRQPGT